MSGSALSSCQAVILTAIPVEYDAVCEHLVDRHEVVLPQGTIYEQGKFISENGQWDVAVILLGMGNPTAAFEAERGINYFKPNVILFVGVAGGLKDDVELGDVVAATKVYGYESGKVAETFLPRVEVGLSSYALEQRARHEASRKKWVQRIKGTIPAKMPKALVGPIASGEKVLASTASEEYQLLKMNYSDALAVEMEGSGFFKAVHANNADALIVRGISDLLDNKKEADKQNYQDVAARAASAFAFEVLAKYLPANVPQTEAPKQEIVVMDRSGSSLSESSSSKPLELFYSYAEEDEKLARQLRIHLSILTRLKLISDWHDGKIVAGGDLSEHKKHLEQAHIILLLVSPYFIASEEKYNIELKQAMARQKAGTAVVVPVILRPTASWRDTPFGSIQGLPRGNKAITSWPADERDEVLANITQEIRGVVERLKNRLQSS